MIPTTRLPKTEIVTSRLGFGTSRLHHCSPSERRRILSVALDLGVMHFDTAPAYGDSLAEIELGLALRGCRDRVILATKYGIPPDPILRLWPGSMVLRGLRVIGTKTRLWRRSLPPISAEGLLRSVESSLKRLKTTWIDILLLHEPSPARLDRPDRILEALHTLKKSGVVRAFGLAGSWQGISAVQELHPGLAEIVQTSELEWAGDEPPQITYGAISQGAPQGWRQRTRSTDVALAAVSRALQRRPRGCLIVSTTKVDNLRAIAGSVAERQ